MRVVMFGATGMIGQGVLRECLLDADVEHVLAVGRTATGRREAKLGDLVATDLYDLAPVESQLAGFDACFFCLGVSAVGMTEGQYARVAYDLTLSVAKMFARLNPSMTFIYVSAAGASSSETGAMWARVRGRTENALQRLPFRAVYVFRPGIIQPLHGIRSKTDSYRWFYALTRPLLPVLRRLLPNTVLSTEIVGRAMLAVARHGAPKAVLEAADISALGHG